MGIVAFELGEVTIPIVRHRDGGSGLGLGTDGFVGRFEVDDAKVVRRTTIEADLAHRIRRNPHVIQVTMREACVGSEGA